MFGNPIPDVPKQCHYNATALSPADAKKQARRGLRGVYFADAAFGERTFARLDPRLAFEIDQDADAELTETPFAVRWTGRVRARYSETYTIRVASSGGVRLWIDNVLVIDAADNQSNTVFQAAVALQAKKKHALRLEYSHAHGPVLIKLFWQSDSQKNQIIPAKALRPGR